MHVHTCRNTYDSLNEKCHQRLKYLNAWFPDSIAVWEIYGTLSNWSLAGGSMSLWALRVYSHIPLPVHSLCSLGFLLSCIP